MYLGKLILAIYRATFGRNTLLLLESILSADLRFQEEPFRGFFGIDSNLGFSATVVMLRGMRLAIIIPLMKVEHVVAKPQACLLYCEIMSLQ
jgi:hypothetical protein